jgi:hypothetical protein
LASIFAEWRRNASSGELTILLTNNEQHMTKNSLDDWLQFQQVRLGPAWRSILASQLASGDLQLGMEDSAITAAASFLGYRESDPAAAAEAYPLQAAAYDVNTDYRVVDRLKIMVAGRLDPAEIAEQTGLIADVLAVWESLFFAVRNAQAATSWLVLHVVIPEREAGNLELATNLKLAIFGGPEASRLVLSGVPCRLDDQVDRIVQLRLKLWLKSEHALEFPVETPAQAIQWVQLSTSFQLAEKRLALEEKKLAARCVVDLRRHELTLKKLALAEHELAEKAAARQEAVRWNNDQEIRVRTQEEAERQARIAASPLAQLRWTKSSEDVRETCPVARSVIPLVSPAAELGEVPQVSAVPEDLTAGDDPIQLSA